MTPSWFLLISLMNVNGEPYRYLSYDEMIKQIFLLPEQLPGCVNVFDALDKWPTLASANLSKLECGKSGRCKFMVIEVGDFNSNLPRVFFSGAVHGNERVGPNAVLESVRELCSGPSDLRRGLTVAVPMTNPYGYFHNVREELGIDPNRDFPYDQAPGKCMQSLTARVVYSIFAYYKTIQSGITFHAGETSISFPWGSMNHAKDRAADYASLLDIAKSLQRVAGVRPHTNEPIYSSIGTMSEIVYSVNGGMEDWAYAIGQEKLVTCTSSIWGEWTPPAVTVSASIFLVESNTVKSPPESELGDSNEVWKMANNIYISPLPRCVRMILEIVRLVAPQTLVVPMLFPSNRIGLVNSGCNQVSLNDVITSCNKLSFLPSSTDSVQAVYDPGWTQNGAYLSYTQNRITSIKPEFNSTAICSSIEFQSFHFEFGICFSADWVFLHPALVPTMPTVTVDGNMVTMDRPLTKNPSGPLRQETHVTLKGKFGFDVAVILPSNTDGPGTVLPVTPTIAVDGGAVSTGFLLMILAVPIALIGAVAFRIHYHRNRVTYEVVAPDPESA